MNLCEVLNDGRKYLEGSYLDARILLQYLLHLSHEEIVMHSKRIISDEELYAYEKLLERRKKLEPIAYIISSKEFFGRDFYVAPSVLIPRADTETLVECVINLLEANLEPRILDLGTGSGCIIVSLLLELTSALGVGIDFSDQTLAVASVNVKKYDLESRIKLLVSDWFSDLEEQKFDVIVSNPPYISEGDARVSQETATYEPESSLYATNNGLGAYEIIASKAKNYLKTTGHIVLEIGENQENEVTNIFKTYGYKLDKVAKDLSGIIRCLVFNNKSS
jgi:release factor glutamine methyltransferase